MRLIEDLVTSMLPAEPSHQPYREGFIISMVFAHVVFITLVLCLHVYVYSSV